MKKLLLISFLSCAAVGSYGQEITNNQSISNAATIYRIKGATKPERAFILPVTSDTILNGIDSVGLMIYVNQGENRGIWFRDTTTELYNDSSYGFRVWQKLVGGGGVDTVYVADDLYVVWDALGHQVIHRFRNDGLISGGIVTWTGVGLTFAISPAVYVLSQIEYRTLADTITLDSAHSSLGRIDAFIVDTIPDIGKITGTASATPATPQEDPISQIVLAYILINAGDTIPTSILSEIIYNENTFPAGEWRHTNEGTLTTDFDNTDYPAVGAKAIYVSSYENNSKIYFSYTDSLEDGTVDVDSNVVLSMQISSVGVWPTANRLHFRFFLDDRPVSNFVSLGGPSNQHGFNPQNGDIYQIVAIPLTAWTWTDAYLRVEDQGQPPAFNRVVMTMTGADNSGTKGFYLDMIQLQKGVVIVPPPNDFSNKVDSVTIISGSDYYWIKGIKHLVGSRTGSTYTADNGITMASNNVKLGGTLTANTTIAGGSFQLLVTGTDAGVVPFRVQNATAGGGTAIEGSALDGSGISGSSTSGTGVLAGSSTGKSIIASTTNGTQAAQFISNDASTNTVHPTAYIKRTTSGTAANGIGTSLEFYVEQSNGVHSGITNQIKSLWTDATTATRTSQLVFTGVNSTATTDLFKLDGNGDATVVNLAGTGSRTVLADANGLLSAPVSDARLKTNISHISKYVDVLGLLKDEKKRGVFYNWKDPKRGTAKEIGFVAQGFEDIQGLTGTMNNTGYKYVNYDRITAILWEQNRLLLERIEALEKLVNDLLKR